MMVNKKGPATIVDVAKEAGVSHSTVSRVLNSRPYIKAETRTKVLEAAERLGYVANLKARGLAGGRLGVIGIVTVELGGSSYIVEMIQDVDRALAEVGMDLMLCTTHRREEREASYVRRLSLGLVDGLIVFLPEEPERYSKDLADRRFPFVLLDNAGSDLASGVLAMNKRGAAQAMEHLVSIGHRRIAHIAGHLGLPAGRDRVEGYREAVGRFGLDDDPALLEQCDFDTSLAHEAANRLMSLAEPPTAIFVASDEMAFAVARAAKGRGIRIPTDLSLVGFDDVSRAALFEPELTTVRQSVSEMARQAVTLLMDRIENIDRPVVHLEIPTELVERSSTAPPRMLQTVRGEA